MKNKKGFTLIELLVAVLIIGILAAIALPQYKKAVWKTRYATLYQTTNSLAKASEAYRLMAGFYTTDLTQLDINIPAQSGYKFYILSRDGTSAETWGQQIRSNSCLVYIVFSECTADNNCGRNLKVCRTYKDNCDYQFFGKICQEATGKPTPAHFSSVYEEYYY
jgi:type IV pilus assembly protein PilE